METSKTDIFIEKAKIIHNDFYDYSKAIYSLNSKTKLIIICPIHGEFMQSPNGHLNGYGCTKCGRIKNNLLNEDIKKQKANDFIESSKSIHGDFYDYSKSIYTSRKDKLVIICPVHGEFSQTPEGHLRGYGCIECGKKKSGDFHKKNIGDFIKKAVSVHGDKYDYSKVDYKNNKTKIIIICKKHGEFNQTPADHNSGGYGCDKCGLESISKKLTNSREHVIEKFVKIHGDRYDYSKVDYKSTRSKVIITCHVHGDFLQNPDSHYSGQGCPKCGSEGNVYYDEAFKWNRRAIISNHFKAFSFYIFRFYNEEEEFYKFGITFRDINKRYKNNLPYKHDLVYIMESDTDYKYIFNLEKKTKEYVSANRYIPLDKFAGHSECFNSSISIEKLIFIINKP